MIKLPPQILRCLPPALQNDPVLPDFNSLREIRLRKDQPTEWVCSNQHYFSSNRTTGAELQALVHIASHYSPWTAETISRGYLTIEGGHRIGFCGEIIMAEHQIKGIREITSACIRIAKDISGVAKPFHRISGSVLIIGAPGWGKTTMLRDLARQASLAQTTTVIDERGELFPEGFQRGNRMDVLTFCPKKQGIDMALRTMTPEVIAVDEITAEDDCKMMIHAANCGVRLLATAHAVSINDLRTRPVYRILLEHQVFSHILRLCRDNSCIQEGGLS